jgi:hypothetical protein
MELRPKQHHHSRDNDEDAMDDSGHLSLRTGTGRRSDDEVGRRRGEIREVDFFSASGDPGTRSRKADSGGCRVTHGCLDDEVHVSTPPSIGTAHPSAL